MYRFLDLSHESPPPGPVLGIEASPEHAALCRLGNLSGRPTPPQRGVRGNDDTFRGWEGRALVDIATESPLPPDGTVLALGDTTLSHVAAAGVLALRALGLWPPARKWSCGMWLHPNRAACDRLRHLIHRATYYPPEWAPRPLPTVEQPWPADPHTWDEDRELAAVAAICGADALVLAEQVATIASWLLWGEEQVGDGHMQGVWAILDACGVHLSRLDIGRILRDARARVEASRLALAEEAAREGAIELHGLCCGQAESSPLVWGVDSDGRVCPAYEMECSECGEPVDPRLAIVRSAHLEALALGFCVARVVMWVREWSSCPTESGGRVAVPEHVTIAGWAGPDGQRRHLDEPALRQALNAAEEERWSRSDVERSALEYITGDPELRWHDDGYTGVCSPTGGTRLSEEAIVREVLACLR